MGACDAFHLCTAWWSGCRDLNPGPLRPERSALPSCATARSELPRSPIMLLGGPISRQRSDDRWHLYWRRFVVFDDDLTDPTTFDRLHAERPIFVGVGRPGRWDLTREIEDESGD